jgi:putative cardiolipin synthase
VSVVHAGYAKYRHELLKMGVELYELDRDLSGAESNKKWKFYQSKASLHAKCFVIDRSLTFIGSLNLDPRSVIQNTEIGMVIESDLIAGKIASFIDREIAGLAFKLELEPGFEGSSHIVWHGLVDGRQRTLKAEPYTSFWQRFMVGMMRLLPIESQL